MGSEGGADDERLEQVAVGLEDGAEDRVLAVEKVVEAAAVGAGAREQLGESCRGVALLPEQEAGGLDNPLAGIWVAPAG